MPHKSNNTQTRANSALSRALTEKSRQRAVGPKGDLSGVNSVQKTGSRQPPSGIPSGKLASVNTGVSSRQKGNVPSGKLASTNTNVKSRQKGDVPGGTFGNPKKLISEGVNIVDTRQKAMKQPSSLSNVNNTRSRQRPGDAEALNAVKKEPSYFALFSTSKSRK